MQRTLKFEIGRDDLRIIYKHAKKACIGGKSFLPRDETLLEKQITGLCGQYALCLWMFGGNREFIAMREEQDRHPLKGDGGQDLPGIYIDVKTSLMRHSTDPADFHLWVREMEYHEGLTYVRALVQAESLDDLYSKAQNLGILLVGWAEWHDLKWDGKRYALPVPDLFPLPPLPRSLFSPTYIP